MSDETQETTEKVSAAEAKIRARIAEAVAAERERIAQFVESWTPGARNSLRGGHPGVPRAIAGDIRRTA